MRTQYLTLIGAVVILLGLVAPGQIQRGVAQSPPGVPASAEQVAEFEAAAA